jgi:putative aldouronate transport system permease protein
MYGVQIAFRRFRADLGIWGSPWVGLEHFRRFINFPNFWLIIANTARLGFYSLATFPITIIFALLINEIMNKRFKKTIQMVTYAPYFLSTVVLCSMLLLFISKDNGLINNVRDLIGLERVEYILEAGAFPHIYVWSGVWQFTGWGTIIYLAALSNVSLELIEAARIDGANRLHIIWHVNIPTIMPTIVILLILSSGQVLSVGFEKVFLLQKSLNLSKSQIIATYVYDVGLIGSQFSYSSAIGLFNTVVNVAMLCLVNFITKKLSDISIW